MQLFDAFSVFAKMYSELEGGGIDIEDGFESKQLGTCRHMVVCSKANCVLCDPEPGAAGGTAADVWGCIPTFGVRRQGRTKWSAKDR